VVIEIATNRPVTMVPMSSPPSAFGPSRINEERCWLETAEQGQVLGEMGWWI
jgi:hypothetical protein